MSFKLPPRPATIPVPPRIEEFNWTNIEHALYAMLFQAIVVLIYAAVGFLGAWFGWWGLAVARWICIAGVWSGAGVGTVFFLGRETAQNQLFERLDDIRMFFFWLWDRDSNGDLWFPLGANLSAAVLVTWLLLR